MTPNKTDEWRVEDFKTACEWRDKNYTRVPNFQIRPTMFPLTTDARLHKVECASINNCMSTWYRPRNNHNDLIPSLAHEITNNIYGNPIGADLKKKNRVHP